MYSKFKKVKDGDILLFEALPDSVESVGIAALSGGPLSHAEMAVWLHGHLCSVGMNEDDGGRAIALQKHLDRGRVIEVYRVRANAAKRAKAVAAAMELLSVEYNHGSIKRQWKLLGPFVRFWTWFLSPEEFAAARDDAGNGDLGPKDCSEAVSWAWRQAGIDLVKNKSDFATTPVDISESAVCSKLFTLSSEAQS